MEVVEVPIGKIKVIDRYREDMGDLEGLAKAIKDKGLLQPITLSTKYRLLAGGRRLEACKLAGLKTVPSIIRKTLGAQDEFEIELIENIARKDLEWPERLRLEQKIHSYMKDTNPKQTLNDTAAQLGMSDSKLHRDIQLAQALAILPELAQEKSKQDAIKKLNKFTRDATLHEMAKTGKFKGAAVYASDHYMIGDALAGLKEIAAGVVGFCEVDPPYGINLNELKRVGDSTHELDRYEEFPEEYYPVFIEAIAKETYRIQMENTYCIWWFGMSHYSTITSVLRSVGYAMSDLPAIWYKGRTGQANNPEMSLANSYETFMVCRKGSPRLIKPARSNVFDFPPVPAQKKNHATEKPVELMDEIMQTFVYPNANCCVPFLGSGVTLRAAYRHGVVGFGWDLAEENKNNFLYAVEQDIEAGLIKVPEKKR